ncbi:MAG: PilZ domain-containing protein [Gammaproteobacteria bacterium]|nr:PilZ domain-containing protein [Gammaproteobacteria bacterium]
MSTRDSDADRRHFSRIPFDAAVRVTGAAGTWDGHLIDLSLNGALITHPDDWRVERGERCTLSMSLGGDIDIRMEAVVAHADAQRVGLQCTHIDLDSITHLRRLLELNLGDSRLLDRELAALGHDV